LMSVARAATARALATSFGLMRRGLDMRPFNHK
jgi:hypothetical protein